MKKESIRKEQIRLLKKHLPHGSIKKIAQQTGMFELSISKILDAQWNNEKVLQAAIAIIKEEQKAINSLVEYFEE